MTLRYQIAMHVVILLCQVGQYVFIEDLLRAQPVGVLDPGVGVENQTAPLVKRLQPERVLGVPLKERQFTHSIRDSILVYQNFIKM